MAGVMGKGSKKTSYIGDTSDKYWYEQEGLGQAVRPKDYPVTKPVTRPIKRGS